MIEDFKKAPATLSKIWLSSPHMGGGEKKYIDQAFDQNWIAPLGPNVTGFETDLKAYLFPNGETTSEVAALSSGTAALHLALILLGVRQGDEVLCQSLTFAASANPIVYQGATPIFIDSEEDTLNICPVQLESAIKDRIAKGRKPKALIAVHLYGMPYKIEEVHQVAATYGIPVIEDSAEALGSSYKGRKCGTFGDMSILSFNGNKIITTSGGGALVTGNLKDKQQAVFLATQARDEAPHYQHSQIGYNYRMSNICAGIGRGQMEVLDQHVEARRAMHAFYKDLFADLPQVKIYSEPKNSYFCNHWLTVIRIDDSDNKDISAEKLRLHLEKQNIESRPLWKPMHMQPVFEKAPYYGNQVASKAFANGLCLPSGSNLGKEERSRIEASVQEFFDKRV